MVKYLVEQGVHIHAQGDYAFKWAVYYNHLNVVKYLVERANIHAGDDKALKYVFSKGHLGVFKYLKEQVSINK